MKPLPLILAFAALAPATTGQETITVLKGAKVYPVSRPAIEDGVVVLAGGVIQVVGDRDTSIPQNANVIDCTGLVITPGLIDAATTLGVSSTDANEQSDEVTPHMHIVDAIDPADKAFGRALHGGVTTVQVSPGGRNVIGGLGAVLKTHGDTVADMLMRDEASLTVTMGSEPSSGNRAIRGGTPTGLYYRRPTTRMGVVWELRKAMYDAQAYREEKTLGDSEAPPVEDPGMEVLLRALDKKLQVRTSAMAEQDIRTALRLAEEFGYDTVLEEVTEAYQVADALAEAKVKVIFGAPSAEVGRDGARPKMHTLNLLAERSVPFAIASGRLVGTEDLAREAMFAMRHGLDRARALASVTIIPAEILGVSDRVGSLAAGKDADLVLWTGEPFGALTTAEAVYVRGEKVK